MEIIGNAFMYLGAVNVWLAVGYLASKVWNATDTADPFDWKWRRPVTTNKGRILFGIGVVGGVVSLVAIVVRCLLLSISIMLSGTYDPWANGPPRSRP